MFSKRIEEVSNPIVYIFITLALSSISYGLFDDFKKLTIFIVSFFFICLIYYCGINFTVIMSLFFAIGLFINVSYYNIDSNINGYIRIIKKNSYETTASYKGKKITLESYNNDFVLGERYKIYGSLDDIQDKSKGIVGNVSINNIIKIDGDFITKLYRLKTKVYEMIEENLGQRKTALISSIAFGYSDYLDSEDKNDMKSFGIIHAISVSGLHVVVVYGFLRKFLGDKVGLLATIVYVIFTGCNYSSIRAFIMIASLEGSHILKRNNNSLTALCLSAIVLLLIKPYSIFEVSFHLSYLATLGIILFNKKFNYLLYKLPTYLRETLSVTLSAQIFTFPYLILVFKDFSINFIIGNLLLIPFINIIVITGNILPVVCVFPKLFDFCSYINLIILRGFDWSFDKLEDYSLPMFYGNKYIAVFYMSMLVSFYFVRKNHKKFIYLPAIFILVISVQIYSPVPQIEYYNEGALLISYKGDRVIVTNKNNIDIKRLKKSTMATMVCRDKKVINIRDIARIKERGKDYILEIKNNQYILKMSASKTTYLDCDIINFKDRKINKVVIFKDKIILSI